MSLLVIVMDAVDLEGVGDNVGDTIKTLAAYHTSEIAGMVALTTHSQDLGGGRGEERGRKGGREGGGERANQVFDYSVQ